MKSQSMVCDIELLRRSLDDLLTDEQEEKLVAHLSTCPACQQQLKHMVADDQQWYRVGEVLRSNSPMLGQDKSNDASLLHQDDGPDDADPVADSITDFAVHFLEPSPAAGAMGRIGTIDIYEVIGRGGMGIVLKGVDSAANRNVAVKILGPHLAGSGAARKRFAREAQSAAIIVHPNVMPILAVHGSGKLPHIVMPFIACESLEERIRREGPADPIDVVRVGLQVAAGLAAAHAQGLVHRDIKPANILMENGTDRVLLTDFGLARAVDDAALTRTGVIAGTPQYMSPEQARGDNLDARSDLFSLGSVLYAMCAGRPPFRAESSLAVLRRITDRPPRPLREINSLVPVWLAAIIERLHAKEPGDRFQSAGDLEKTLQQCLAHLQQPTQASLPKSLGLKMGPTASRLGDFGKWAIAAAMALGFGLWPVIWVATNANRDHDDPVRAGKYSPTETVSAAPAAESTSTKGNAKWNDGVTEEILSAVRDTDSLDRRVRNRFDEYPAESPVEPPRELSTKKE